MGVILYQSGKLKKLLSLPQLLDNETLKGIRRGQTRLRKAVGEEFRNTGVGRSMFRVGYRKGALKTILARERVKKVGELYEVGLRIKGIAAIVGRGGRTSPHQIGEPRKALSNQGFFAIGSVRHPGSKFQRDDFPTRAVSRVQGSFRAEVAKGVDTVAGMVNRG
jgi:hypothetical protein